LDASAAFTIREKASYFRFGRSLGGPQKKPVGFLEDINVFSLPGIEPLSSSIVQHVAYLLTTVAGIRTHLYYKSVSFSISYGLGFSRFSYYVYFKYLRSSGNNKQRIFVYPSDFQMCTIQSKLEPARSPSAESITNPMVLRAVEKLSSSREIIQILWLLREYDRNIT
jgi:hypothetical protein